MISLFEAQELVAGAIARLDPIDIPVESAAHHIAAADIVSGIPVPSFRAATMDGVAVASGQLTGFPVTLEIDRTAYAGSHLPEHVDDTKAMKVMTGAPIPEQYDTVVPFEDTAFDNNGVTIKTKVSPLKYIRMPGVDVGLNETLIRKGDLIRPLALGVLASTGLTSASVIRKPRTMIMSTGDELVSPGEGLRPGQVYDSNSRTIEAMTRAVRSSVEMKQAVADDVESLKYALNSSCDVIITTGGVSAGERDYLPLVAKQIGWTTLFHKVSIKPGKPIFVATRGSQTLFGLPGNPLSAAVTCAVLLLPALKKMTGFSTCYPVLSDAILSEPSPMKSKRTIIWPGRFSNNGDRLYVTLSAKTSSSAVSALLGSDGLVFLIRVRDEEAPTIKAASWREMLDI